MRKKNINAPKGLWTDSRLAKCHFQEWARNYNTFGRNGLTDKIRATLYLEEVKIAAAQKHRSIYIQWYIALRYIGRPFFHWSLRTKISINNVVSNLARLTFVRIVLSLGAFVCQCELVHNPLDTLVIYTKATVSKAHDVLVLLGGYEEEVIRLRSKL